MTATIAQASAPDYASVTNGYKQDDKEYTTEAVKDGSVLARFLVDQHVVAGEQAVVAVLVSDDLNRGINFVVALDESTDGGGQARGEATCGQQGNTTDRHECHLSQVG